MTSKTNRNILLNTIASSFYLFCNWLITILVVSLSADYEASGSLAVAMAVGNIFTTIMLFRVRIIQVSDMENTCSTGDYIAHRITTFLLASIFCFIYSLFTVSVTDYIPVFAFLCFKSIESFIDVYHGLDQKFDRFEYIAISQIARGVLIVLSFCVGMLVFNNLSISFFLMAGSTGLFAVYYDIPKASKLDTIKIRLDITKIEFLFSHSVAGFFGTLCATIVVSLPRQLYGLQFGNEALGLYAALATPAVLVQALASYIYAPLIGPISHDWKAENYNRIRQICLRIVSVVSIAVLLMSLFFIFFGSGLFQFLFQKDVSSYIYLIYPLLISTGFAVMVSFISDLLIIAKCYCGVIISNGSGLLAALLLTTPLIHLYGANGVSFTIICSFFITIAIALAVYIRRIYVNKNLTNYPTCSETTCLSRKSKG